MRRIFRYYAIGFLFVFVALFAFYLSQATGLVDPTGRDLIGRDFVNYYSASRLVLDGHEETLLKVSEYRTYLETQYGIALWLNWSYPPHYLFFVFPLALLGYLPAYAVWVILGGGLFILLTRLSLDSGRKTMIGYGSIALASPAFIANCAFGQNGFITGTLLYLGVRLAATRPVLAGACLGALTVKPQLGLLIPVFLVLRGHWLVIASAAVTSIVMIGLSALIFGIEMWQGYIDYALPYQRVVAEEGTGLFLKMMPTAFALGRLQGWDASAAMLLQAPFSLLAFGLVVWAFRRPSADAGAEQALLIVCVFMFSPYSFNYDMTALVPALFLLLAHETEGGRHGLNRLTLIMAGLYLLPLLTFIAPFGPVTIAASALVLAHRIEETHANKSDMMRHGAVD